MTAVSECVAKGAAFLDQHDPEWWRPDVDRAIILDRLDLSATNSCVLGQRCPLEVLSRYTVTVHGDAAFITDYDAYWAYARHLSGLSQVRLCEWAHEHGFTLNDHVAGPDGWPQLTAEWRRVITRRRETAEAVPVDGEGSDCD
jgi:hypothetical protein